jgi:hypothetical protein
MPLCSVLLARAYFLEQLFSSNICMSICMHILLLQKNANSVRLQLAENYGSLYENLVRLIVVQLNRSGATFCRQIVLANMTTMEASASQRE